MRYSIKYMIVYIIIVILSVLWLSHTDSVWAETIDLMKNNNRTYIDVNKTKKHHENMCWYASHINVVGFTTGTYDQKTMQAYFEYQSNKAPRKAMAIIPALDYIYRKEFKNKLIRDSILLSGHFVRSYSTNVVNWIHGAFLQNDVVEVVVKWTEDGKEYMHLVTAYKFESLPNGSCNLWVVDSNDRKVSLFKVVITKTGQLVGNLSKGVTAYDIHQLHSWHILTK